MECYLLSARVRVVCMQGSTTGREAALAREPTAFFRAAPDAIPCGARPRPFFALTSCLFIGSTRSGSYLLRGTFPQNASNSSGNYIRGILVREMSVRKVAVRSEKCQPSSHYSLPAAMSGPAEKSRSWSRDLKNAEFLLAIF